MSRLGTSITLAAVLTTITPHLAVGATSFQPESPAAPLEIGTPVLGTRLFVRSNTDPRTRRIIFQANDPSIAFAGDAPTLTGAWLDVFNPVSGEAQCLAMPAVNWMPAGGAGRYIYRDPDHTSGPVDRAFVMGGRVKIIARGAGIAYTLDESSQGEIDGYLVGGDGSRFCARFGAPVADRPGVFLARRAPAVSCLPSPAPCGPSR